MINIQKILCNIGIHQWNCQFEKFDTPIADNTVKTMEITRNRIARFVSRKYAFNYSQWIILGDDGLFWAVTPADFERLVRAGYQVAL